jgi:23S rRNA (cytidine1920-2'-O)/16S rRNA (cytidine1409-2'-O)-methyltransferase
MRLDRILVEKGYETSRVRAKERIERGDVSVRGTVIVKPSFEVSMEEEIVIAGDALPWVSRAGLKLEHAFEVWRLDVARKVCLDIGASTGGFTEVLLEKGAQKVYALDVGHGQLHQKLRNDQRVVSMESMHVKNVSKLHFKEPIDCVVIDVSFISLEKVLPKAFELLESGAILVALIKPQFEVGKNNTKKGIVVDDKKRTDAVTQIRRFAEGLGFIVHDIILSPVGGGDGNTEFLMYAIKM